MIQLNVPDKLNTTEKPFAKTLATLSKEEHIELKWQASHYRTQWQRTCHCPQTPGIIAAPVPPKLIAKGKLGISVWVEILLGKYAFGTPVHRLLQDFHLRGLDIAQGTVTGGLECIDDEALFATRDRKLREHLQSMEKHRDEQLSRPRLRKKPTKVLKSLQRHWEGLTRFMDDPGIPLDIFFDRKSRRAGIAEPCCGAQELLWRWQ